MYTMRELIKSTEARIAYNLELARTHPIESERKRFEQNAADMREDIETALTEDDTDWIIDNRDW
jgi:hypothetical protein